jgi:hypothetical protein
MSAMQSLSVIVRAMPGRAAGFFLRATSEAHAASTLSRAFARTCACECECVRSRANHARVRVCALARACSIACPPCVRGREYCVVCVAVTLRSSP